MTRTVHVSGTATCGFDGVIPLSLKVECEFDYECFSEEISNLRVLDVVDAVLWFDPKRGLQFLPADDEPLEAAQHVLTRCLDRLLRDNKEFMSQLQQTAQEYLKWKYET